MPVPAFRQLAHVLTRDFAKAAATAEAPEPLKDLSKSVDSATSSLLKTLHHEGTSPRLEDIKTNFAELGVRLVKFLREVKPPILQTTISFLEKLLKVKNQTEIQTERVESLQKAKAEEDLNYWQKIFPFDRLIDKLPVDHTHIATAVKQNIPNKLKEMLTDEEYKSLIAFCLLYKGFGVKEIQEQAPMSQSSAYRYEGFFKNNNFSGLISAVKAKWFMLEKQNGYNNVSELAKDLHSFFNVGQATVYHWIRENQDAFPKFPPTTAEAA